MTGFDHRLQAGAPMPSRQRTPRRHGRTGEPTNRRDFAALRPSPHARRCGALERFDLSSRWPASVAAPGR
ncbi:hypothetical protein WS70_27340 [Burkholderia mayonis]|uniref:Uncharacterized protein n=1 Tax=Burkholderia mayonis TaxID=1385591 RepID=A0A1B4FP29_9BURK|nr:hypothetical protein WS70_27340 [Burkholderia mayonis]KVE47882.1 hypothetical protein WS70_25420 [Burkholderia mayonis]